MQQLMELLAEATGLARLASDTRSQSQQPEGGDLFLLPSARSQCVDRINSGQILIATADAAASCLSNGPLFKG